MEVTIAGSNPDMALKSAILLEPHVLARANKMLQIRTMSTASDHTAWSKHNHHTQPIHPDDKEEEDSD